MGIWECMYGNMGMWYVCMYVLMYVCMGTWECEDYSTHISATAELVFFSAYIHVPAQAMLNLSTNKAFYYR